MSLCSTCAAAARVSNGPRMANLQLAIVRSSQFASPDPLGSAHVRAADSGS
jgi:hypothetical protein